MHTPLSGSNRYIGSFYRSNDFLVFATQRQKFIAEKKKFGS
jgi:hypothetical protein